MKTMTAALWLLLATLCTGTAGADETTNRATVEKIQVGTGRFFVKVSAARTFTIDLDTEIRFEGQTIEQDAFVRVGTGRVARFTVGPDVDDLLRSGTLQSIDLGSSIKGPITSIAPLAVLDIPVLSTSSTFLEDVPSDDLGNLSLGDIVEVDGFSASDSSVQASRIEYKPNGVPEWKVSGIVSSVLASELTVGQLSVSITGVTPDDCDSGLMPGAFVEIKATPDSEFVSGATLATTTDVECKPNNLGGAPGNTVPAAFEGFITQLDSGADFFVGDQAVSVTPNTEFDDGGAEDLVLGARVEVEGLFDTSTGILTATEIEFKEVRVRAEAPLQPADVNPDGLRIFGFDVLATPQTEDEDGILSGGLSGEMQVEVRGFVDLDGTAYATEVREVGAPDLNDVRLRGPVESISRPEISILGVTLDTTGSTFQDDDENTIDADTFFAALTIDSQIQIENATYDSGTNTISGGQVELEDSGSDKSGGNFGKGENTFGLGLGVVTESGDILFTSSFE